MDGRTKEKIFEKKTRTEFQIIKRKETKKEKEQMSRRFFSFDMMRKKEKETRMKEDGRDLTENREHVILRGEDYDR